MFVGDTPSPRKHQDSKSYASPDHHRRRSCCHEKAKILLNLSSRPPISKDSMRHGKVQGTKNQPINNMTIASMNSQESKAYLDHINELLTLRTKTINATQQGAPLDRQNPAASELSRSVIEMHDIWTSWGILLRRRRFPLLDYERLQDKPQR